MTITFRTQSSCGYLYKIKPAETPAQMTVAFRPTPLLKSYWQITTAGAGHSSRMLATGRFRMLQ